MHQSYINIIKDGCYIFENFPDLRELVYFWISIHPEKNVF